jgi:hypothetical protein
LCHGDKGVDVSVFSCTLKSAHDPVDIDRLAAHLALAGFYRVPFFRAFMVRPKCSIGLGIPEGHTLPLDDDWDKSVVLRDIWTEEAAVRFLKTEIARVQSESEPVET